MRGLGILLLCFCEGLAQDVYFPGDDFQRPATSRPGSNQNGNSGHTSYGYNRDNATSRPGSNQNGNSGHTSYGYNRDNATSRPDSNQNGNSGHTSYGYNRDNATSRPGSNQNGNSGYTSYGYNRDNGPATWPKRFPGCNGRRQSPINIDMRRVTRTRLPSLQWRNYDNRPTYMQVHNEGHAVDVTGRWRSNGPSISGGPLSGTYVFEEIHYHWGESNSVGSEHLVNGLANAGEMHAVFYKKNYGSLQEAMKQPDGIAVVGYFLAVGKQVNLDIQRVVDSIRLIRNTDERANITVFSMEEIAPIFSKNYVTYEGSLTTPPCTEVVTFIIYLTPLYISSQQLAQFRTIRTEDGQALPANYRPVQKLNGRRINCILQ